MQLFLENKFVSDGEEVKSKIDGKLFLIGPDKVLHGNRVLLVSNTV
jgi:hypothetical protein